jgi:hypothetical protein
LNTGAEGTEGSGNWNVKEEAAAGIDLTVGLMVGVIGVVAISRSSEVDSLIVSCIASNWVENENRYVEN